MCRGVSSNRTEVTGEKAGVYSGGRKHCEKGKLCKMRGMKRERGSVVKDKTMRECGIRREKSKVEPLSERKH